MRRIAKENRETITNIDSAIVGITSDTSDGAQLLQSVTLDLRKALVAFNRTKTSFDNFRNAVLAETVTLGYSARIAQLSEAELKAVYDYLSGLTI